MPALTARRLATALGCQAMSLYHHFPSRQHLLDALVEHAIAAVPEPAATLDPIAAIATLAREYRATALRHPRLFHAVVRHRIDQPAGGLFLERMLPHFHAAIPDSRLAVQAHRAFEYYVTGAVLDETSGHAAFELGLAMVLKGLAELRASVPTPPVPLPKPVIRPKP